MPDNAKHEVQTRAEVALEPVNPFPVQGYLILNAVFWAFCILEIIVVRIWLKDIQGVIFFFILLAVGFSAVSVYDWACDRLAVLSEKEESAGEGAAEGSS
jgi:hypothetical protein